MNQILLQVEQVANRRKQAALLSVISNTGLIAAKLAVGLGISSVSVISEAIHSSVDLVAAIMALVAIRMAARPADHSHPFGHGKYENVSGTAESLLIFMAAGLVIFEAAQKFNQPSETGHAVWGMLVMGGSAVVNFGVSRYLWKVGRETDSVALQADAAHLQTDVLTSAGVFLGLGLVWLSGWHWLDPLTALIVALLILKSGWSILLHSFAGLVDASLPLQEETQIITTLEIFSSSYINFHELRTRQAGPARHIDFHLVVKSETTVEQAHILCNQLEEAISQVVNGALIQIHIEPESVCANADGIFWCSTNNHK